jgi:ParB-like chromosome segregation protein Spo0J
MQEPTSNSIEIDVIDLRYASFRLPDKKRSEILLSSISESGILDPILGIKELGHLILLDGFKRVNCAKKLGIKTIPFETLGDDCALGIIKFLKLSNSKSLQFFEQAKLVEELKNIHQMNIPEIARRLERSSAWVSIRLAFLKEMSDRVQEQVFKGQIPPKIALYTLRQIKRLNKVSDKEIERFTNAIAGKGLSIRDCDHLAHAYFKGGESLKKQIESGNLGFALEKMKKSEIFLKSLSEKENRCLNDLEIANKYVQRINNLLPCLDRGNEFISQASLLAEGILSHLGKLTQVLNNFLKEGKNDQSGAKADDLCSAREGNGSTSNSKMA